MILGSRKKVPGFTLVELLVVISIIGILSTLAAVAVNRARVLAKEAKARGDLRTIRDAIALLEADTGKWPNGCPPYAGANPEVDLTSDQAGLVQVPEVGNQGTGCLWTQTDINLWRGPYIDRLSDPWGSHYWFDPDFVPYQNCPSQTTGSQTVAIESFGPNKTGVNSYDCDDVFLQVGF